MPDFKYFLDNSQPPKIHAFRSDGSQDTFILAHFVSIEGEEVDLALNPSLPITAEKLKEIVTRCRWEVETGGVTLPNGVKVATGIDDQNRITTVVANARLAALQTVNFKAATGWVTLTLAEIEGVAAAVAMHVQACFTAEHAHHEAIDAIALTADPQERQAALDAYDEAQGWPGTCATPETAL